MVGRPPLLRSRPAAPVARRRPGAEVATHGGFTFLALVVTMGLLGMCMGVAARGLQFGRRGDRQPTKQTEATVLRVKAGIDSWKARFNAYPPMRPTDIARDASVGVPIKQTDNSDNEPIEALYQAMYWPGFGTEMELSPNEQANIDEDKLPPPFPTSRGCELKELIDAWGNPLVYFVATQYMLADGTRPRYRLKSGAPVQPRPWREEGGGFVNPNGFQLFSMGEDGKPNTEDDLKGW